MERVRSTDLNISKCIIVHVIQARYRNQNMIKKKKVDTPTKAELI